MYYPKAKIQENQYTKGSEYQYKDSGEPYMGSYSKLSDGRFFSGKTISNTSKELVKIQNKLNSIPLNSPILKTLVAKSQTLFNLNKAFELKPSIITPTEQDYKRGFITRFFAKKINAVPIQIFEINEKDYNSILNNDGKHFLLYQVVSFNWKITGPLYDDFTNRNSPIYGVVPTNKRTLQLNEPKLTGITQYFGERLSEFAK